MKKIYLSLVLLLILGTSCKKVLDKQPLNIISDNAVWTDPTLIDSYLTQVYSEMITFTNDATNSQSWVAGDMWFDMFNVNELSDESKALWVDEGYGYKFGNLKVQGGLLEWWPYNTIRELNDFIARVPASTLDPTLKKQRLAEARFLRAFCYFGMVKRYGGVPLITVPQSANDDPSSLYPTRTKEEDIYKFIISELDAASNDLATSYSSNNLGRPTKYAALALECRAALYAGSIAQYGTVLLNGVVGINQANTNIYYQKAYDVASAIISSGAYSLYNKIPGDKTKNYRQLFLDKDNPEVIFSKRHNAIDPRTGGAGWAYDFFQSPAPQAWGGGNQDAPYLEMVEEYENVDGTSGAYDRTAIQQGLHTTDDLFAKKDPRFAATIYTQNTIWKGALLQVYKGVLDANGNVVNGGSYNGILATGANYYAAVGSNTGFGVLKYLNEGSGADFTWGTSSQDYIVLRYGEVLLNYAEAAFELNKPTDALNAINQIRARAGMPLLTSITRDQIRHERKIELAFEGHRYWDLRRWRLAVTQLSKPNSGLQYILDSQTKKFKILVLNQVDGTVAQPAFYPQNYYFPITLTRTANNKNLVENPGY